MNDLFNWQQFNYNHVRTELDKLNNYLKQYTDNQNTAIESAPLESEYIPALQRLQTDFSLNEFEKNLLLLCIGVQLDREFGEWCAKIRKEPHKPWVSFDLALQIFNQGKWLPFTAQSSLRYWHLLEVDDPRSAKLSPLRVDEAILHTITGDATSDQLLEPYLLPGIRDSALVESHQQIQQQICQLFNSSSHAPPPVIILDGSEDEAKPVIASLACHTLGLQLHRIDLHVLPRDTSLLHELYKRIEREGIINRCGFIFEGEIESHTPEIQRSLSYLLKRLSAPCLVTANINPGEINREAVKFEVSRPAYQEQKAIWQSALSNIATPTTLAQLPGLLDQFDLGTQQINSIIRQWQSEQTSLPQTDTANDNRLWALCREQSRHKVSGLARIIEPVSQQGLRDSLVLSDEAMQTLQTIIDQVKQRHRVYQDWGFAQRASYGLGISALFAGTSGTGKTLAARVIASELELDVYQIDLSAMVSKYIGETEKNLERIFNAAQNSGAILLFDEADALFGKRSQVNDSKDRYANMEVSYLLQRMESYTGLSILTTNFRNNLDDAFVRRLRFIVQFPFPQDIERKEIWQSVFPDTAPQHNIDYEKLSRLEIAGGLIRSIAINAAFHAAKDDNKITMQHIKQAVTEEFTKSEKTLLPELVADW